MSLYENLILSAANKIGKRAGSKLVFVPNKDLERQSFRGSLTPGRLNAALTSANQGYMQNYFDVCQQAAEIDAHLASVVNTRKLEVSNLDWSIQPVSQDSKDIEVAEFCTEIVENIPAIREHIKHLLNGIMYGISGNEIIWENNGRVSIAGLTNIRPQSFTYVNSLFPMLVNPPGNYSGVPMEPNKFIVHKADSISGLNNRAGVMRHVLISYMFKSFSLKDWGIYSEIYNMPFRVGKYDTASGDEISVMKEALADISADASIVIPKDADIEFHDVSRSGQSPYKEINEFMDSQMSKAVLGQKASTDGTSKDSFGANDQKQVRQDIKIDDAKNLADTLKRDLLRPIVWFNFGQDMPVPNWAFDTKQKPDLNALATRDSKLAKEVGLPMGVDYFYSTYGIEKPEDDEELVSPPGSGSAFGEFKQTDPKLLKFGTNKDFGYLKNNLCVFNAVNFLDTKYEAAADQASNITQEFYNILGTGIQGVDSYEMAIKFINGYELNFNDDVLGLADNINANLAEIYEFGRKSVNPNAKPEASFVSDLTNMSFNLIPQNVLEFLRVQSFSISHITHRKILEGIRDLLVNNMRSGLPYGDFRRQANSFFDKTGYTRLNPFHLETVYIQNGQNAYHAGKLAELTTDNMVEAFPMWRYVTVGDDRVRPAHAAMDGFTAEPNSPVWIEWYPPNGFRCRCDIEPLTASQVAEDGVRNQKRPPKNPETKRPVTPDRGFSTNPARLGVKFSNWFESNVSWKKVRNSYSLNSWSTKSAYGLGLLEDTAIQTRTTLSSPDEIWGLFDKGIPSIIYLKKFEDADGSIYYYKVTQKNNATTFEGVVPSADAERIGVPLKTI